MYANAHETHNGTEEEKGTSTPFRFVSFLRQPTPSTSAGVPCLNLHSFVSRRREYEPGSWGSTSWGMPNKNKPRQRNNTGVLVCAENSGKTGKAGSRLAG